MIDQAKLAQLKTASHATKSPKGGGFDLEDMTRPQLEFLHSEIGKLLPRRTLSAINLEDELLSQFSKIKQLQDDTMSDDEIPPNQRAQVAGQVAATLQQLIKMQVDLQRDEQMKKMEAALLEALNYLTDEARDVFFAEYSQLAEKTGAAG